MFVNVKSYIKQVNIQVGMSHCMNSALIDKRITHPTDVIEEQKTHEGSFFQFLKYITSIK